MAGRAARQFWKESWEPLLFVMIASIDFHSYRVLECTTLTLDRFNLILGPNGSGKSTAVQALLTLAGLAGAEDAAPARSDDPEEIQAGDQRFTVSFGAPFTEYTACVFRSESETANRLEFRREGRPESDVPDELLTWLRGIRSLSFEAATLARPCRAESDLALGANGSGFSALLGMYSEASPEQWRTLVEEFSDLMPEFTKLTPSCSAEGVWSFTATNQAGLEMPAERLSQGTLVALAIHALAYLPDRPTLLCLEELERGIHPRLLREVHDSLYRLCYPEDDHREIAPVQVLATTHSPYLLDLFSDHPEEVVLSVKEGSTATFQRLTDLEDLDELMQSGSLGDLWYSGVIGGVPY